jgi:hypothetical protein
VERRVRTTSLLICTRNLVETVRHPGAAKGATSEHGQLAEREVSLPEQARRYLVVRANKVSSLYARESPGDRVALNLSKQQFKLDKTFRMKIWIFWTFWTRHLRELSG